MNARFRFSYERDWRRAPMAFWVHVPVPDQPGVFDPPAPTPIGSEGYAILRFEYGPHELVFSSPEQLQHCIDVLSRKPLPTSRNLSRLRGPDVGPNRHWLSRFPVELKAPAARPMLVKHLKAVQAMALGLPMRIRGKTQTKPPLWPGQPTRRSTKSAA